MPKWIHDRAKHIQGKNPDMDEGMSFAIATQQAHKLGKSPKTFKSKVTGKKERFGTPEGRRTAKAKFDKPKSEYKKTAEAVMDTAPDTNDQNTDGQMQQLNPQSDFTPDVVNDVPGAIDEANQNHKNRFKDVAKWLDNVGEKPTFQREVVVNNPTADKPNTPTIKVAASDVMWDSFFAELQKIAQGGSSISETIQDLIKGDGPASTDVRMPQQRQGA